jgi:hypothetical protein
MHSRLWREENRRHTRGYVEDFRPAQAGMRKRSVQI